MALTFALCSRVKQFGDTFSFEFETAVLLGRGRDTVSQVLRVRSDLRRQTAPPAVGADEIARHEREPAGGFHVRRRRDRPKASRVPSSVQRARNRLVSHHYGMCIVMERLVFMASACA